MRFDEVQKLSLDHLTILSDGTTLEITESIKNSTETHTYKIEIGLETLLCGILF